MMRQALSDIGWILFSLIITDVGRRWLGYGGAWQPHGVPYPLPQVIGVLMMLFGVFNALRHATALWQRSKSNG